MLLKPTMTADKDNEGFGTLSKLAPELRFMIYQQSLDKFQQIFDTNIQLNTFILSPWSLHTTQPFLRPVEPIPNLMLTSKKIRAEVLDSAFSKASCTIIMGERKITTNFPLTLTDQLGSPLTFDNALIATCRELFIGIEMPSPREVNAIAQLRQNMKNLTTLLNNIASRTTTNGKTKQKFPQLRVSFECDSYRAGLMYYRNDFETFVAPLHNLIIPLQDDLYNAHRKILIDRSCRWLTLDKRHETCRLIEDAVQDPASASKDLIYHQLSIDIRLGLALLVLYSRGQDVLVTPPPEMAARLAVASRDYVVWHQKHCFKVPAWVKQLRDLCESANPDQSELQGLVAGLVVKQIVDWVNGHLSGVNPFWIG